MSDANSLHIYIHIDIHYIYIYIQIYVPSFLHNQPLISRWIKSSSNELNITFRMPTSQFSGHCDIISNRIGLQFYQQNVNRTGQTWGRCVKIVIFIIIYKFIYKPLCHVRNKIMYVFAWWAVYALTWVLFLCLFSLLQTWEINTKIAPLCT